MDNPNLQQQSILVTEILNLGSDPVKILDALVSSRSHAIGWLQHDKRAEEIVETTETIRDLSFIINELSKATGKDIPID